MKLGNLISRIKEWVDNKFTGIITIHFNNGGIRKITAEEILKD